MKKLDAIQFDYAKCREQLADFHSLLSAQAELSEKRHVLPFFRTCPHVALLFGGFNPRIERADRIAWEFDVFGDFACDLIVEEWGTGSYCFVEFEDALANSVFDREGKKATREYSRRFDHGCSQIIDWFPKLDDRSKSDDFVARFGLDRINYDAVLVIGRDQHLDAGEKLRLDWRSSNVIVHSKRIHCLTFDQLLGRFSTRLNALTVVGERAGVDPAEAPNRPAADPGLNPSADPPTEPGG